VLDGSVEDVTGDLRRLREELRLYDERLLQKRAVVVVNKLDVPQVRARESEIRRAFGKDGVDPIFVAASSSEGVASLWAHVSQEVAESKRMAPPVRAGRWFQ